ncbi:hypothetical protein LTR42_002581 [Elasticomyces elasticus]|nr:hypothetical protein LTR42_002581 [Elasticomyces elasticus]
MPLSAAAESYFLALGAAIAALPLYLAVKVVRQISQTLFVGPIPGEINTALLATPLPKQFLKDHRRFAHNSAKDLSVVVEYDYIIVGGGTAGCVLASRLSENPDVTVLVVEAGHSDLKYLMARVPVGGGQLMLSGAANWDYRTEAEPFMDGQKMWWPRGRLLSVKSVAYRSPSLIAQVGLILGVAAAPAPSTCYVTTKAHQMTMTSGKAWGTRVGVTI